MISSKLLH